MRRLFVLLLLCCPVLAQDLGAEQQRRYHNLIQELRCLVCQNQNIADSNAPLAADLREQVQRQIAEGRSDDEIKAWASARYGDFVLYRPRFGAKTLLLWLGPALLVSIALGVALMHLRRARAGVAVAPDAAALERLLAENRSPPGKQP